MNELNRHKKSDKIKWTFTGIAFLLIFVMFTGLCLQLFGTGKQKPSEWFKKPDTEQTQSKKDSGVNEAAGGAFISESNGNGVKLMSARIAPVMYAAKGVSAQAESAYTITATITPATATDKSISWSIAWANASSSFANGKNVTDYVTITPTADGSSTANISCLQAFGEQVLITATVRANSDISATATVDYVKRVSSFDVAFNASEVKFNTTYNFTISPVYSVGTIQGELVTSNYDFALTDGFKSAIEGKMNTNYVSTLTYYSPSNFTIDESAHTFAFKYANAFLCFAKSNADKMTSIKVRDDFNNAFANAAGEYSQNHAVFKLDYTYTYNGTTYSSGKPEVGLKFDSASLIIYPVKIELSQTNFVF